MPKKLKGGTLWGFFNIQSVSKFQNTSRGTVWWKKFQKSLTMPKKTERGDLLVYPGMLLRGKRGKTFLVQFPRPNDSI